MENIIYLLEGEGLVSVEALGVVVLVQLIDESHVKVLAHVGHGHALIVKVCHTAVLAHIASLGHLLLEAKGGGK